MRYDNIVSGIWITNLIHMVFHQIVFQTKYSISYKTELL